MAHKFHIDGTLPVNDGKHCLVFGSNYAGRHGAGAAKAALKFGAKYGCGAGFSGNTFAIPTKDGNLKVLPLDEICQHVAQFLEKARTFDQYTYFITRIGCGLAGYRDEQIAPMFAGAPNYCSFSEEWRPYIEGPPSYDISI